MHAIHPNEINRFMRNLPKRNRRGDIRAQNPNETVGAVPACPPERPRSGVSIPKIYALCVGVNDGCAPAGRLGRAHRHRPYPSPSYFSTQSHTNKITIYAQSAQIKPTSPTNLHQTTRCAITSSHCTFDSPHQPRGVPLPHRGYTFDSAGLASATQPTLGNGFRQVVLPTTWVVLFLIAHHYHTRRMNDSPHAN